MADTETVEPLASLEDVAALLGGRDLTDAETARLGPILAKASGLFRRESGQHFTEAESTVLVLSEAGRLRLPQRPARTIHSLTREDGSPVSYRRLTSQVLTTDLPTGTTAVARYEHGATVPDDVRWTIAEIGKQILNLSAEAEAGVTQYSETTGPFTESRTYAAWALGGRAQLSPEDKALARSFRARRGATIVMTA